MLALPIGLLFLLMHLFGFAVYFDRLRKLRFCFIGTMILNGITFFHICQFVIRRLCTQDHTVTLAAVTASVFVTSVCQTFLTIKLFACQDVIRGLLQGLPLAKIGRGNTAVISAMVLLYTVLVVYQIVDICLCRVKIEDSEVSWISEIVKVTTYSFPSFVCILIVIIGLGICAIPLPAPGRSLNSKSLPHLASKRLPLRGILSNHLSQRRSSTDLLEAYVQDRKDFRAKVEIMNKSFSTIMFLMFIRLFFNVLSTVHYFTADVVHSYVISQRVAMLVMLVSEVFALCWLGSCILHRAWRSARMLVQLNITLVPYEQVYHARKQLALNEYEDALRMWHCFVLRKAVIFEMLMISASLTALFMSLDPKVLNALRTINYRSNWGSEPR